MTMAELNPQLLDHVLLDNAVQKTTFMIKLNHQLTIICEGSCFNSCVIFGLHSIVAVATFHTQQPRVRIPTLSKFFGSIFQRDALKSEGVA